MFAPLSSVLPLIRLGRLRPLVVTTTRRSPAAPDIPTVSEAGLAGYEYDNWHGLAVPARTPGDVVMKIHEATISALKNPTIDRQLRELNYLPVGNSPEVFAAFIRAEIVKLSTVIQEIRKATR